MGFDAVLMNGKVLGDDGRGTWSWVANGIIWAAPAVDIVSTFPRSSLGADQYTLMSATSMAAPFVAGLAGLVWTAPWGTSNTAVRDRIQSTVDPIVTDQPIGGRINAARAVGAR